MFNAFRTRWKARFRGRDVNPPVDPAITQQIIREQRRSRESRDQMVEDIPHYEPNVAQARQIQVTPGLAFASGNAAWFGLRRIVSGEQPVCSEFGLEGFHIDMLSCDVDGVGFGARVGAYVAGVAYTALPWGDTYGTTAAIVIGVNLPMKLNGWTEAPCAVPGIADGDAAMPVADRQVDNPPLYLDAYNFPVGKVGGDCGWLSQQVEFTRLHRVPKGSTLDVALVLGRNYVNGLADAHLICARVRVGLRLCLLDPTKQFRT